MWGNCAGTSCYHLTGMEISMQNPQAVEVWFVSSLEKTCAENSSIATEWGWRADKQRRVSDPVCDVVHLCFSSWCSVNAHMAVTACSTVAKKYFQLKILLYKIEKSLKKTLVSLMCLHFFRIKFLFRASSQCIISDRRDGCQISKSVSFW